MTTNLIYLDGFSNLPLAPEAQDAMIKAWKIPGNAGSPNAAGEQTANFITKGRNQIASLIGAAPSEIIFTSGATEANNLAIIGVAHRIAAKMPTRRRIIISAVEHKAVTEPARILEQEGFIVTIAPVDNKGRLDLDIFRSLVSDDLLLASVMFVNNEIGVIQPVAEASKITHAVGAFFHSDAAQAVGKLKIDSIDLDIDYLSLSAHKMYGPIGIGALFVAAGVPIPCPLFYGGGQQQGIRPGTEPAPLIAGFGAAAAVAHSRIEQDITHGHALVDAFLNELSANHIHYRRITDPIYTIPGGVGLQLTGIDAAALCNLAAHEVAFSSGSACTSGQIKMSHVLKAIRLSEDSSRTFIRIFCHRYQTETEVRYAANKIASLISRCQLATGDVHQ